MCRAQARLEFFGDKHSGWYGQPWGCPSITPLSAFGLRGLFTQRLQRILFDFQSGYKATKIGISMFHSFKPSSCSQSFCRGILSGNFHNSSRKIKDLWDLQCNFQCWKRSCCTGWPEALDYCPSAHTGQVMEPPQIARSPLADNGPLTCFAQALLFSLRLFEPTSSDEGMEVMTALSTWNKLLV